jgi:hypothetical protein
MSFHLSSIALIGTAKKINFCDSNGNSAWRTDSSWDEIFNKILILNFDYKDFVVEMVKFAI